MNIEESDLLLFPDPGTVAVLPWRPQQGRVIRFYCDIRHPDGTPFMGDGRHMLQGAIRKAADMGYVCKVRSEEHTSELQSLPPISYAVFCLKKRTK